MSEQDLHPLILDLVEWVGAKGRRPYDEVMDAWRTSCPRLPVWETAVDRGYLARHWDDARGAMVLVTDAGRTFLAAHGRAGGRPAGAGIAEGRP